MRLVIAEILVIHVFIPVFILTIISFYIAFLLVAFNAFVWFGAYSSIRLSSLAERAIVRGQGLRTQMFSLSLIDV